MNLSQYDLNKIKNFKSKFYKDKKFIKINNLTIKKLYIFMSKLRMVENALAQEYHPADQIRCPVHFCVGQEAMPAAVSQVIQKKDYLFCHHRSHGYFLTKDTSLNKMFAELYGKKTGSNNGFAGSQDISSPKSNFFAGAILAGTIGIAVGNALAQSIDGTKNIVFTCFGESATDQGIFWESLNYSSLHNLPIIFICENNNYSVFSPQNKRQKGLSIADKAKSFGVKSIQINGNDVINNFRIIKKIYKDIKKKSQPFLIEAFTSRWSSHYGPEDDSSVGYREKDDLNFWKKNCPINHIETLDIISQKEKKIIKNKIAIEIEKAFTFAKNSKFLEKVDWYKSNYAEPDFQNFFKMTKKLKKVKKNIEIDNFQPKGY